MVARASWKGTLKIGELLCPIALYTAASTSDRIAFHTINRATGSRVRREFVDAETEKPVPREDQVKGYELGEGEHIVLQPDEIAAAIPESDKVLSVQAFLPCTAVDAVFFDKPYYLAPADKPATEAFALIRDGLRDKGVVAIAQAVLFRRMRTVLIRANGQGLIGTTLNFDYEVRPADQAFKDIPDVKIEGEMLDLARHIIGTKMGTFDVSTFDDRYEAALAELVKAKIEGRAIKAPPAPKVSKPVDLLAALRESAKAGGKPAAGKAGKKKTAAAPAPRKKAS